VLILIIPSLLCCLPVSVQKGYDKMEAAREQGERGEGEREKTDK